MVQYVYEGGVRYRFSEEDGEPGIQVLDDEGDWVWLCYLGDDGKLYLPNGCDYVSGLQIDSEGKVVVGD